MRRLSDHVAVIHTVFRPRISTWLDTNNSIIRLVARAESNMVSISKY